MGRCLLCLPLLVAGIVVSAPARAQQGSVSFSGELRPATCVVQPVGSRPGSRDMTVDLYDINEVLLREAGQAGTAIPFTMLVGSAVQPCLQRSVRGQFQSAGHTNAAGRLDNTGTARNVDVVIYNEQMQQINLNDNSNTQTVAVNDLGQALLTWFATFYSTGRAQPGTVVSRVMYTIEYP